MLATNSLQLDRFCEYRSLKDRSLDKAMFPSANKPQWGEKWRVPSPSQSRLTQICVLGQSPGEPPFAAVAAMMPTTRNAA
jgi:hypothetical protein